MRVSCIKVLTLMSLLGSSSVLASPIQLDEAVKMALANNKELQSKRLEIKTAESELLKARLWSPSNPQLEIEAVTDALTANSGEGTMRLGLSQEIELGGQRGHRRSIANAHIELIKLEVSAKERTLARDVRAAFYSLLLAQQRLSFTRFVDSLSTSLRDTAAIRVRDGFLPKSELTFLQLDVAASQTSVGKAEVALNESRNQLQWLLGEPPDSALELAGEIEYQPLSVSEDSIVAMAIAQRSELKENSARQNAVTAELGLARGERIPNLTVSAFYSRDRSVFGANNFIGNPGGIQGLKDVDNLFGIRLSLPLPLWDKRQAEIAGAQNQGAIIAATNLSLENQIRYEARNAYRALKSAERTLELLQQVQPESDSLFQLLQSAYSAGRVSISDYLTQKDRLLITRLNLFDAYSNYVGARKEVERSVGLDWNQIRQGEQK